MKVRRFDPTGDLIIVKARLYGPRGHRPLSLAFDTAATETHIVPEVVDDLGYSPRQGEAITSVSSAIGKELGYMLRVTRSQTEQRDDILISTLRAVVGALGGRLVVKALFDDGAVEIKVDNREHVA